MDLNSRWSPLPPPVGNAFYCYFCRNLVQIQHPLSSDCYCNHCNHCYTLALAPSSPYFYQNPPPPPPPPHHHHHCFSHQSAVNGPYMVEPSVTLPWNVQIESAVNGPYMVEPSVTLPWNVQIESAVNGPYMIEPSVTLPWNVQIESAVNGPCMVEPSVTLPLNDVQIGRKKALICGISYKETARGPIKELKGCINDAKSMKFLLIETYHFPESNIRMLTDEEGTHPSLLPTKENIISSLKWLVEGCRAGDSLVFHFAGHGVQKRDKNGDEKDEFDEELVPVDSARFGNILDDEINKIIVNPLPEGVKLHAIIDACHSGTMLDLEWVCKIESSGSYFWDDHRPPKTCPMKGTKGGEVFAFSGCEDDKDAGNAPALVSPDSTGAMTFAFIQTINLGQSKNYGQLLMNMRSIIKNMNNLPHSAEIPTTKNKPLIQVPQLSANKRFDVDKKEFKL